MTDPIAELVAFLRARLAEDDQVARAAVQYSGLRDRGLAEDWEVVRVGEKMQTLQVRTRYEALTPKPVATFSDPAFDRPIADHIARHDPARVLREVEAKRRIIAEHPHRHFDRPNSQWCETCHDEDGNPAITGVWCKTLRLLALPYADHPDYREEWRP